MFKLLLTMNVYNREGLGGIILQSRVLLWKSHITIIIGFEYAIFVIYKKIHLLIPLKII